MNKAGKILLALQIVVVIGGLMEENKFIVEALSDGIRGIFFLLGYFSIGILGIIFIAISSKKEK